MSKVRSIRAHESVWTLLDAEAQRRGVPANALAVQLLEEALDGGAIPEPVPRSAQVPAAPAKLDRARDALKAAQDRVGVAPVKARLDTSMVSVFAGGKRPAYQRGAPKAGRGKGKA